MDQQEGPYSRGLSLSQQAAIRISSINSSVRAGREALGGQRRASPPPDYGTHSMRLTKPTLIYRRTHNLRAVQLLLGHTELESTVRYLGIEVEDALALSEETEV